MPPLVDYNSNLDLDDKILLWQSCAGPYPQKWTRRSRAESMREDIMDTNTSCHLTVPGDNVSISNTHTYTPNWLKLR